MFVCSCCCIKIFSPAASRLSTFPPDFPPCLILPLTHPLPLAPLTFCLPHMHVPPYRKKGQVSKRHSQVDQLTQCLTSETPQEGDSGRSSRVFISVQPCSLLPPIASCAATFWGDFPGLQPLFHSNTSLSSLSYNTRV